MLRYILAGYYDFNANVSFTFQAVKNLYAHPTYLCFGDAVTTLQTFVWILNDVSRSITWSLFILMKLGQVANLNVLSQCDLSCVSCFTL